MTHFLHLQEAPFEKIRTGQKTIELRLNDEKRRKIKPGDTLVFTNLKDPQQTLCTTVVALHPFPDFEALYRALPLTSCGYTEEELPHASPEDMQVYYAKEDITNYGVLGIELRLA